MATATVSPVGDNVTVVTWSSVANGETGGAAHLWDHADRSIQVFGTFGAGGTVVIQGSNEGTTWATLNDPQGNALSFTAAKIEGVLEHVRYIRPNCTAGDGTTDLTVVLFARKGA